MVKKIFYVDGACSGNPGPGGFGVVSIGECDAIELNPQGNKIQVKKSCIAYFYNEQNADTTNNREELKAILHVFQLAADNPDNQYIIYSDSAYAVNIVNNWIRGWASNNWKNSKNKTVENIDLIKEIYKYLNTNFFNCQVVKVNGHAGLVGNELADALATQNNKKFLKWIKDNDLIINYLDFDFLNKL